MKSLKFFLKLANKRYTRVKYLHYINSNLSSQTSLIILIIAMEDKKKIHIQVNTLHILYTLFMA